MLVRRSDGGLGTGVWQRLGLGNWFELAAAAAAIQVMEVGEGAAHLNLIRILWKKKIIILFFEGFLLRR